MKGYVYVIRAKGTNKYKIGRTVKDVQDRLSSLRTGSPHELVLIECKEFPECEAVERALHDTFAKCRGKGEWFEFDDIGPVVERLKVWASGREMGDFSQQDRWTTEAAYDADDYMSMLTLQGQVNILRSMVIDLVWQIQDLAQKGNAQNQIIDDLQSELLVANREINKLNGLSDFDPQINNSPTQLREWIEFD